MSRRKGLSKRVDVRLKEIIRQTALGIHAAVIELETLPDHTCTGSTCRCAHLDVIEQYIENQESV
jgi:REP element-mobilizing transposase RayT